MLWQFPGNRIRLDTELCVHLGLEVAQRGQNACFALDRRVAMAPARDAGSMLAIFQRFLVRHGGLGMQGGVECGSIAGHRTAFKTFVRYLRRVMALATRRRRDLRFASCRLPLSCKPRPPHSYLLSSFPRQCLVAFAS